MILLGNIPYLTNMNLIVCSPWVTHFLYNRWDWWIVFASNIFVAAIASDGMIEYHLNFQGMFLKQKGWDLLAKSSRKCSLCDKDESY